MWSARVSLPCRLSWQTFHCCSVQSRALAKVMSTFLLIQELCKLFTLKPETRWNWPGLSSKLIFWPDLPKDPQRFRYSVWVPPEQPRSRAVPGPRRTLGGQPDEGVWAGPSVINPCPLLFNLSLSLPSRFHWVSQAHVSQGEYIWKALGAANAFVVATDLKSPSNRS